MDATPEPVAVKECRRCHEVKSIVEFGPAPRNRDGLHSYCRPCDSERVRTSPRHKQQGAQWYAANREKKLADNARWRHENADRMRELGFRWRQENVERNKARHAAYYRDHPDKCRAATRAWTSRNQDRMRQYQREWRRLNRDSARVSESRRRARKRAAHCIKFTAEQLIQRWTYYGNKCWICGGAATQTDHVKPLSKGGPHILANLRPICGSCNGRKGNRWPL